MQKLAALLLYASCACAYRHDMTQITDLLMMSLKSDANVSEHSTGTFQDFLAATAVSGRGLGDVHGVLIGNLIEGLQEAVQILKLDPISIVWSNPKLTVSLPSVLYGQVATRSSVPVMWVVDETLTVTVEKTSNTDMTLRITGLHTDVPQQAHHIYKQMMNDAKLQPKEQYEQNCGADDTSAECKSYLDMEHQAAETWIKGRFKQIGKGSLNVGKIGMVLSSLQNHLNWAIKKFIAWPNWGSIVYSMVSACPKSVKSITFKDGKVFATTELWEESENFPFARDNYLLPKAQILGADAITNAPKMLADRLAAQAKSGWGFGMLFGHGDDKVKELLGGYPEADAEKLVNLFSRCQKRESQEDDPSCTGRDKGRLHWTTTPPGDYQKCTSSVPDQCAHK